MLQRQLLDCAHGHLLPTAGGAVRLAVYANDLQLGVYQRLQVGRGKFRGASENNT